LSAKPIQLADGLALPVDIATQTLLVVGKRPRYSKSRKRIRIVADLAIDGRFLASFEVVAPPKDRPELGPCWTWRRRIDHTGYAQLAVGHQNRVQAHRWSYERYVAKIPDGLDLDHLCRNRACVNYRHLEPVSRRENILRGQTIPAANVRKTHCARGHEYTIDNTYEYRGARQCRVCRAINARNAKLRGRLAGARNG